MVVKERRITFNTCDDTLAQYLTFTIISVCIPPMIHRGDQLYMIADHAKHRQNSEGFGGALIS